MCGRDQHLFARAWGAQTSIDFATPAAAPHYAPDLALEPEHLALDVAFELGARRVSGSATTTVLARHERADSLTLDAVSLTVHEVRDVDGHALSHAYDGSKLVVTWATAIPVGERRRVVVRYEVSAPISGLTFSDDPPFIASDHETQRARYWFPCVDHPSVRTTVEVALLGPAAWHLLGPGVLVEEVAHDDATKTARWKLDARCPAYLLCVAMGDFAREDGGVHRGPDGREVPIAFFAARAEGPKLERTFGPTRSMMDWMVAKLGRPFPFPKYFQFTVPAIGGAMENITLVSWDDFCLLDERGARDRRLRIDAVNVHEMAHSYFGDAVVIRDYAHAWLKESWASYMESVWVEDVLGADDAAFYRSEEIRDYRSEADGRYHRPIVTRRFDSAWDMFDMHLYPGGASRLHMLRRKLGDRAFWDGTKSYLASFDGKTAETTDFMRCLEASSGLSLQRFFDEWFHAPGYPTLKASFAWSESDKVATLTVEQTQRDAKKQIGTFELGLTVAFEVEDGRWEERSATFHDRCEVKLACATRPRAVILDPRGDLVFSLEWSGGDDLIARGLEAPTAWGRIQAARALGHKAKPSAIAALEARYRVEPFYGVRIEIARALEDAGTGPAAAALARLLSFEKDDRARPHLARAAGAYRDPAIAAALVAFLEEDLAELGRAAALEALGKQRGDAHLALLRRETLEAPSWGFIQRGAVAGLAETRSEQAVEHLLAALEAGRRRPVRLAAAEALGSLARWLPRPARAVATERLADLTRDPDYGTRLAAVRGLGLAGAQGMSGAFEAAERMAAEQDVPRIRRASRSARDKDPNGGAIEKLKKQVEELEERLRKLETKG
ncbi:MAG: M1 family aminopeptidase [Polyangiaceae bacterium]